MSLRIVDSIQDDGRTTRRIRPLFARHTRCNINDALHFPYPVAILMRHILLVALLALSSSVACVKAVPPTDTGDPLISTPTSPTRPTTPTTPTIPTTPTALAYNQDLKAVFQSDCVTCHGPSRADGNYRMTTYAQVMTALRAGNASSTLVAVTAQNGNMYRYWSGSTATRQAKAAQVRSWVVTFNAQENR